MTPGVLGAILVAAILHAAWNAITKWIPDRLVSSSLLGTAYAVVGAVGVALLPLPAGAAWPFLIASSLTQVGYLLMLVASYQVGDFSQVYPIARGLSPLLVTIFSVAVLGQHATGPELLGIAVVCAGIGGLVFVNGWPKAGAGHGLAAITGLIIATYTLLDGVGVRHSGGHPVSYAMWLFLLQGPVLVAIGLVREGVRRHLQRLARVWWPGLTGGVLSLAAYAIVVWAQSRSPLASVATLRETSVIFGAGIGWLVFGERFGTVRLMSAVLVAAGIVAIAV